jgi:hypothetical protein
MDKVLAKISEKEKKLIEDNDALKARYLIEKQLKNRNI